MIISGSTSLTNSRQAKSMSSSLENVKTYVPIIGAHESRVKIFLMKGSSSPSTWHIFPICMILSLSGVGNFPS